MSLNMARMSLKIYTVSMLDLNCLFNATVFHFDYKCQLSLLITLEVQVQNHGFLK